MLIKKKYQEYIGWNYFQQKWLPINYHTAADGVLVAQIKTPD